MSPCDTLGPSASQVLIPRRFGQLLEKAKSTQHLLIVMIDPRLVDLLLRPVAALLERKGANDKIDATS
jgi:hypothetical protein